jgi:hypothetical protein
MVYVERSGGWADSRPAAEYSTGRNHYNMPPASECQSVDFAALPSKISGTRTSALANFPRIAQTYMLQRECEAFVLSCR